MGQNLKCERTKSYLNILSDHKLAKKIKRPN